METMQRKRRWTLGGLMLLIAAIAVLLLFPVVALRQRQLALIAEERALAAQRDMAAHARVTALRTEQQAQAAQVGQANHATETDELRRDNEDLKQRIAELERRLGETPADPQPRP